MNKEQIDNAVVEELQNAYKKFPTWPDDPIHAAAIVAEESGELMKATVEAVYEPRKQSKPDMRKEALQTIAVNYRFLLSLDRYKFRVSNQHGQKEYRGRREDAGYHTC